MSVPKLRFEEFQNSWKIFRLEEIASVERGKFSVRPRNDPKYFGGHLPFIQTGDVSNANIFVKNYSQTLNYAGIEVSRVFPEGTILITIAANIGDTAITQFQVACPDSLVGINPNTNITNTYFLKYVLDLSKETLDSQATQNAQKNINLQILRPLPCCLPVLEEQTKIATFLFAVDEKIAQLSRKHELLLQYKQGMMQQLFSQKLRFKDDKGEDFPEWGNIKLKDFLSLESRPVNKPDTNYHALGVKSHFKGLFNKIDSDPSKISMDTLYRVKKDDFVVNITFAWEGALAFAELEHDEGLVSHRFPTYRCDDSKVVSSFFKYRFTQMDFLTQVQLCSPGGAGRNRVLKKSDFLEIEIEHPPLEEQTKIANFLNAIDNKINVVTNQLQQAREWKQGLLQQMFE